MERGLKWTKRLIVGAFALLTVWTAYWSVVAAPALRVDSRNVRTLREERSVLRGEILAADMQPLAVNDPVTGRRTYVGPLSLAHLVGYSDVRYGKSGIERAYNGELLGMTDQLDRALDKAMGRPLRGWDVVTTIDLEIQRAAHEALGDRKGAVVVLDPNDGSVLAMVSSPTFDPGRLGDVIGLADDGEGPLYNRATMGQYPPGSAFKPVIMIAALETRAADPGYVFDDQGYVVINGKRIENSGQTAYGPIALDDALVVSSNAAFAHLAVETGARAILETGWALGIGMRPSLSIPAAGGRLPTAEEVADEAALAAMGIGQGSLLVTPMQMAMVAAAIANGGWAVEPRVVRALRAPGGAVNEAPHSTPVRAISPGVAHIVREAMIRAVESGTGAQAKAPGVLVAGKTGTAENPHGRPHAWFIGFAPARSPRIAFAIVVENGGGGGAQAAPIARAIVSSTLRSSAEGDY